MRSSAAASAVEQNQLLFYNQQRDLSVYEYQLLGDVQVPFQTKRVPQPSQQLKLQPNAYYRTGARFVLQQLMAQPCTQSSDLNYLFKTQTLETLQRVTGANDFSYFSLYNVHMFRARVPRDQAAGKGYAQPACEHSKRRMILAYQQVDLQGDAKGDGGDGDGGSEEGYKKRIKRRTEGINTFEIVRTTRTLTTQEIVDFLLE